MKDYIAMHIASIKTSILFKLEIKSLMDNIIWDLSLSKLRENGKKYTYMHNKMWSCLNFYKTIFNQYL